MALFTVLAREAERHAGDFDPQALANTAWAFATVGLLDALLFTALAGATECMGEFTCQDLSSFC